jgi:hypothetical protein
VQLYKIVFRQGTRASGHDTLSPRQKRRASVGMLGGICDVAEGAQQPQTHGDIGGSVMPNLLECGVKQTIEAHPRHKYPQDMRLPIIM